MKTPATFTDEEAKVIELFANRELAVQVAYRTIVDEKKFKAFCNNLTSIRNKCWAQLHGTEATDVESV
jgi:hypothetical protein